MRYVRTSDNTVVTIHEIRAANLQSSIPDDADCTDFGYEFLIEPTPPEAQPWCRVVEGPIDGYTLTYIQEPMSAGEIERTLVAALDRHYDSVAQGRRYYDRYTCAVRAGYTGPFQAEGLAFATWMDTCNALGYQIMAEVKAGTRPIPSVEELLAAMPAMVWPT